MSKKNCILKCIYLTSLLGGLFIACENNKQIGVKQLNSYEGIKNVSVKDEENDKKISNLIRSLRTYDVNERNNNINQLKEIIRKDSEEKEFIDRRLLAETKKICKNKDETLNVDELNGPDFFQLKGMSELLAEDLYAEALDVLVDCSNRSTIFHGYKASDYATITAVAKFKNIAIPVLKEKLATSPIEVKCHVTTILAIIDTEEANSVLKEALKSEKNTRVSKCITFAIKAFENS